MLTRSVDPKHLSARIGITAELHTWGSAMSTMSRVNFGRRNSMSTGVTVSRALVVITLSALLWALIYRMMR